jgi:hypothetical protein
MRPSLALVWLACGACSATVKVPATVTRADAGSAVDFGAALFFPTADLGTGQFDPWVTGQWGCHSYGPCSGQCDLAPTPGAFDTCQAACDARASKGAKQKLDAVSSCAVGACIGEHRCLDLNDISIPCVDCVLNLAAAAFGTTCPLGDPVCGMSTCSFVVSACAADLP